MNVKQSDVPVIHILRNKKCIDSDHFSKVLELLQPILQTKGSFRWAVLFILALYASHLSSHHLLKMKSADIKCLEQYLIDFTDPSEMMIIFKNLLMIPENGDLLISYGFAEKVLDLIHSSDDEIRQSTLTSVLNLLLEKTTA